MNPPTPAEWVAPGPDTLATALDELEARLAVAEAMGGAAARWQNQRAPGDRTCDAVSAPYFAFSESWRVAAQRARAQADRVGWLWQAPTLDDVKTSALDARVAAAKARAAAQAESWGVFTVWHERYGPTCETVPPLVATSPGGPPVRGATAVWLVSGVLCPNADAELGVKVLPEGAGCVAATAACDCTPGVWVPGSVVGP